VSEGEGAQAFVGFADPVPHNLNMLFLASASPRRSELLSQAGFAFKVQPADIPEDPHPYEDPIVYVTRLARAKAQAVYDQLGDPSAVVLGADTTVIVDDQILGKPVDAADAARMLRLLSGRAHVVATGIALVTADAAHATVDVTTVYFNGLTGEEIDDYIATGEPMDKAGAYGIQGRAACWIPRIEGCYFNVVGLPVARVAALIQSLPKA
jgi:septum formation protein